MKNYEVVSLASAFDRLATHYSASNIQKSSVTVPAKFILFVSRNLKLLTDASKELQSVITMSDDFIAFENERAAIVESLWLKQWDKITEEYSASVKELEEKYKDAIAFRTKQIEEYNKLLDSDFDGNLELSTISDEFVPDNMPADLAFFISDYIKQ